MFTIEFNPLQDLCANNAQLDTLASSQLLIDLHQKNFQLNDVKQEDVQNSDI